MSLLASSRGLTLPRSYHNAVVGSIGIVASWALNEITGTVARDEFGKVDGTYTGSPTLGVAGPLSKSPSFGFSAATGKYVSGTATSFPGGASPRTVAAWVQSSETATTQTIFQYGTDTTGNKFAFDWNPGAGVGLAIIGFTPDVSAANQTSTVDGNWHFVVATNDGVSGRIYEDAALLVTGAQVLNTTFTTTTFQIGQWSTQGIRWLGQISNVHLWSRALSGEEIAMYYRLGRGF